MENTALTVDREFEKLKQTVLSYAPGIDAEKLERAYALAKDAHEGQVRNSGEPYLYHPVFVAQILAEYELDCDTIVGALLHDVVEDTKYTLDDIRAGFGNVVAEACAYIVKRVFRVLHNIVQKRADNGIAVQLVFR